MSLPMPANLMPLQHPTAWQGRELSQEKSRWHYTLTSLEISELKQAADRFLQQPNYDLNQITTEDFPLPTLSAKLQALQTQLIHGLGFQLWSGLPIKNYSLEKAATIFCGLGSHLGQACSQNAKGHLLGHVKDTSANAQDTNCLLYTSPSPRDS